MLSGTLDRLSRAELIELVVRMAEMVALVGRLEERIAELEGRLGEGDAAAERAAPPMTSASSSVPPSVGFTADQPERRTRKRRRGRTGISRRRQAPEVIVRCRPSTGAGCGESLPPAGQRRVGRSRVIEGWQYAARRWGCGTRTFEPQLEALRGYVHERHHVGYARLVEVCRDLFGLQISEGGIDLALRQLAERARPTYEAIGAEVRAGPVIGSNETSARVAGRNAWQWVFQMSDASFHLIVPRRTAAVIAAFLGETRPEGWLADLWSPQLRGEADTHQLGLSHQLRNLTYAVEADGYAGRRWAVALRPLFGRAIHLHQIRDTITPTSFQRRRVRIDNAVDRLVFRTCLPDQPDTANARRLQARYQEHRTSRFVFVDRPDVPPTNHASEQDLHPSVIHGTVTGGFRSQLGADGSAIFTSLLTTAR